MFSFGLLDYFRLVYLNISHFIIRPCSSNNWTNRSVGQTGRICFWVRVREWGPPLRKRTFVLCKATCNEVTMTSAVAASVAASASNRRRKAAISSAVPPDYGSIRNRSTVDTAITRGKGTSPRAVENGANRSCVTAVAARAILHSTSPALGANCTTR